MSSEIIAKVEKIRRIEKVYNKHIRYLSKLPKNKPTKTYRERSKHSEKDEKKREKKGEKKGEEEKKRERKGENNNIKKKLSTYQKFVKEESKKAKYRGMPTKNRLKIIAEEWRESKKKYKQ